MIMLCLCLSLRSFADNGEDRHEVAFSYGGIAPAAFAYSSYFNLDFGHASIGHYLGETDFVHRMKNIGVFSLAYYYHPLDWLAVGARTSVTSDYGKIMNANTYELSRYMSIFRAYDISLGVKFVYFRRPWVRLYSEVFAGGGVLVDDSKRYMDAGKTVQGRFVFQSVPIGVSVGKRLSCFLQLELGTSIIGASGGISYRF